MSVPRSEGPSTLYGCVPRSCPGTLCGNVLEPVGPSQPSPGLRGGRFEPCKGLEAVVIKMYLAEVRRRPLGVQPGLWFFCLASRHRVTWADMGPPTDNRGPLVSTSSPISRHTWPKQLIGRRPPRARKRAKRALLGPPTGKPESTGAKPPKWRSS